VSAEKYGEEFDYGAGIAACPHGMKMRLTKSESLAEVKYIYS